MAKTPRRPPPWRRDRQSERRYSRRLFADRRRRCTCANGHTRPRYRRSRGGQSMDRRQPTRRCPGRRRRGRRRGRGTALIALAGGAVVASSVFFGYGDDHRRGVGRNWFFHRGDRRRDDCYRRVWRRADCSTRPDLCGRRVDRARNCRRRRDCRRLDGRGNCDRIPSGANRRRDRLGFDAILVVTGDRATNARRRFCRRSRRGNTRSPLKYYGRA